MPESTISRILDHNRPAAAVWGVGGRAYDDISFAISDALKHAAQRLSPKMGEQILDVATGTGWSARNVARTGARVTAVDIAPELIQAAEELSTHVTPRIDYRVADAEALPFADGQFDRVISTFGVMFAGAHAAAARELGRVCRKGGRLCLATWAPDGAVARFFAVLGAYSRTPPPEPSPLRWGDPNYVEGLLGRDFALIFEWGVSDAFHDSAEAVWAWYLRGFGPLRTIHDGLDEAGRIALKRDVDAYHDHYRVEAGLHIRREYLITIGERR
ncbi:class I SAM-dependent methyltransferase [Inquilinus limosus]|uniref:class I SAM-dependent methyltransferase n=1 Tax=Inquilinus limosus TaxID=171674 RepID=UPI003F18A6CA